MGSLLFHLVVVVIVVVFLFASTSTVDSTSDALLILQKIKPALNGDSAAGAANLQLSSWNSSTPLCLWRGLQWSYNGRNLSCDTNSSNRLNQSLYSDPSLQLVSIRLPAAELAGTLPSELSLLSSLQTLLLPVNSISGHLPVELGNAPYLAELDLSNNQLNGTLPVSLWNLCGNAVEIRLHGNNLTGAVPDPAVPNSTCDRLKVLDLGGNRLDGGFPLFLTGFHGLNELDLESNRLSGSIPNSISELNQLQKLNLSYNNFTGSLPSGLKFGVESFEGNPGLCGAPLEDCGSGSGVNSGTVAGVVIGVMAGVVVVASVSIFWAQGRKRRNKGRHSEELEEEIDMEVVEGEGHPGIGGEGKLLVFQGGEHLTLDEVLNATGQVLEKTSYGTVYKAKLAEGGSIALRLLREGSCRDPDSCLPVVRQLGRARHENLVPLRAFYQGKRGEQLLIYDYLPNKNLYDLLHENIVGRPPLTWSRRHKIALGVARGLAYLHSGHESPITHGNIRSQNILVDDFFVSRLAEYGVDKLVVPAVADEMMSAAKSDGYKAPELQKMKKCSLRTDVYAFGILLLEILMGRKPKGGREGDLPSVVKVAVLEETTTEIFDAEVMRGVRNPMEEGLVHALRLAMGCCAPVADVRPDMREVVRQLEENRPRNRSALYSPAESRSGFGTPRTPF